MPRALMLPRRFMRDMIFAQRVLLSYLRALCVMLFRYICYIATPYYAYYALHHIIFSPPFISSDYATLITFFLLRF